MVSKTRNPCCRRETARSCVIFDMRKAGGDRILHCNSFSLIVYESSEETAIENREQIIVLERAIWVELTMKFDYKSQSLDIAILSSEPPGKVAQPLYRQKLESWATFLLHIVCIYLHSIFMVGLERQTSNFLRVIQGH